MQLNADKTEVLWFGSTSHLRQLYQLPPDIRTITSTRAPSNRQQLVVTLGCGTMPSCLCASTSHGCRRRASTTYVVCVLYDSNLAAYVTARLVSALVLSRRDYCNAVLVGLPASTLAPLQRVINAAARLVAGLGPRDHVTHALYQQLHWLPIAQRIEYKIIASWFISRSLVMCQTTVYHLPADT